MAAPRERERSRRIPAAGQVLKLLQPRDDPPSGDEGLRADKALRGRSRARAGPPKRLLEAPGGQCTHARPAEGGRAQRVAAGQGQRRRAVAASPQPRVDERPRGGRERRGTSLRLAFAAGVRQLTWVHRVALLHSFIGGASLIDGGRGPDPGLDSGAMRRRMVRIEPARTKALGAMLEARSESKRATIN